IKPRFPIRPFDQRKQLTTAFDSLNLKLKDPVIQGTNHDRPAEQLCQLLFEHPHAAAALI
ncbi:MAG: hypothetical protein ACREHD_25575, partial [Pirellulales bacterium]